MIFHYCNEDVFNIIAKTKTIWLSNLTKMNDDSEYKSGYQIILEVLEEFNLNTNDVVTAMSDKYINSHFKILIACFSEDGDMLSQWRAYADDGKGFSIGFDHEEIINHNMFNRFLEKMEPIEGGKIHFSHVDYDEQNFRNKTRNVIKKFTNSSSPIKYILLARALMYLAFSYKDKFFREEKEVRAVIPKEKNISDDFVLKERASNYGDTDYYELNTSFNNFNAIKKIIIGPKNPNTITDVKGVLEKNGIIDVEVSYSTGRGKYR